MVTIHADPVPLAVDEHGVIRVAGTRVPLETILRCARSGASAEAIAADFPTVGLANVHSVLAYCLNHPDEVDAYMADVEAQESDVRDQIDRGLGQERVDAYRAGPGAASSRG